MALFAKLIHINTLFLLFYGKNKQWVVFFLLFSLQTILGVSSLEEVIHPKQVIPQYVMYNMTNTSKHGVVTLQDKSGQSWILKVGIFLNLLRMWLFQEYKKDQSVEGMLF